MVRGSRNRAHASNDSCESMVAERFSFVKYGQKEHWAVRLWPIIERALGEIGGTDERAALLARRAELVAELERIDEQIRAMEEGE